MLDQFEKHPEWPGARSVCNRLVHSGFKAYLAGGCVRDALLGRRINDFDIATDAHPDVVSELFPKSIDLGREFGVIAVVYKNEQTEESYQIEITSFRKDGDYLNGRHPKNIVLSTPTEDAQRRDFTVNALFFDWEKKKIIDYVGGQKDLKAGLLKAVGDADLRFKEDHLRCLRAVRFRSQLGFDIEPETLRAISFSAQDIDKVSAERVRVEVDKMFLGRYAYSALQDFKDTGLWDKIFKIFSFYNDDILWANFKASLYRDIGNLNLVWAQIFIEQKKHEPDFSLESFQAWMKEFKYSNKFIKHCIQTLKNYLEFAESEMVERIRMLGSESGTESLQLIESNQPEAESLGKAVEAYLNICDEKGFLPEAFLKGNDLMLLGIQGTRIGEVLKLVYDEQLIGQIQTKEQAIEFARENK